MPGLTQLWPVGQAVVALHVPMSPPGSVWLHAVPELDEPLEVVVPVEPVEPVEFVEPLTLVVVEPPPLEVDVELPTSEPVLAVLEPPPLELEPVASDELDEAFEAPEPVLVLLLPQAMAAVTDTTVKAQIKVERMAAA